MVLPSKPLSEKEKQIMEKSTNYIPENIEQASNRVISESDFEKKYLKVIRKNSKALRGLVHEACIQAMLRAYGMDNYTYMTLTYTAVKDNLSVAASKQVRMFFERFAPCKLVQIKDGKESFRKNTNKVKEFSFEEAYRNPWHTMVLFTSDEIVKLSQEALIKRIDSLIKGVEKKLEDDAFVPADETQLRVSLIQLKQVRESLGSSQNAEKPSQARKSVAS